MSEWLSIIIVVLIIAIILDGLRRARNARRGSVRLSKNARKADKIFETEIQSTTSDELGSVGAKRKRGTSSDSSEIKITLQSSPEQTSLDLEDPVPMLMDSVENQQEPEPEYIEDLHQEPSLGDLDQLDEIELDDNTPNEVDDFSDEVLEAPEPTPTEAGVKKSKLRKAADYFAREASSKDEQSEPENKQPAAEEILVVNVMAKPGTVFPGELIKEVLTQQKLKFGQMGIFHRHHEDDGDAASIFSVANIVEPGVFDLSTMHEIESPGLCLFLPLPSPIPAIEAYENLIATARNMARELGGDIKDENRSALTNQTIEHGRQRVLEFERKHKLHK